MFISFARNIEDKADVLVVLVAVIGDVIKKEKKMEKVNLNGQIE